MPRTRTVGGQSRTLHRLQIDFTTDELDFIDSIKDQSASRSKAEVVRNALRLYRFMLDKRREGSTFVLRKSDGQTAELVLDLIL